MERNSTFAARHPVTVFIYWLSGVLFTMMTMRVEVLLGSFFPAALYCLYLEGAKMAGGMVSFRRHFSYGDPASF